MEKKFLLKSLVVIIGLCSQYSIHSMNQDELIKKNIELMNQVGQEFGCIDDAVLRYFQIEISGPSSRVELTMDPVRQKTPENILMLAQTSMDLGYPLVSGAFIRLYIFTELRKNNSSLDEIIQKAKSVYPSLKKDSIDNLGNQYWFVNNSLGLQMRYDHSNESIILGNAICRNFYGLQLVLNYHTKEIKFNSLRYKPIDIDFHMALRPKKQ